MQLDVLEAQRNLAKFSRKKQFASFLQFNLVKYSVNLQRYLMPNSMEFEKTDIEFTIVQGNFGKLVGLLKEQLQTHGRRTKQRTVSFFKHDT